MLDERDDHRPMPPQPSGGFPSVITVNVAVSGGLVIEFKTTSVTDDADLKKLTDSLTGSDTKLGAAVTSNPVPTP